MSEGRENMNFVGLDNRFFYQEKKVFQDINQPSRGKLHGCVGYSAAVY